MLGAHDLSDLLRLGSFWHKSSLNSILAMAEHEFLVVARLLLVARGKSEL